MQPRTQSTRSRPSAVSATSTGMAPPRPYAGQMSHAAAPPGDSNVRRAATITLSSSCSSLEIRPSRRRISPTAAAMICRRASAPMSGSSGLLFTFFCSPQTQRRVRRQFPAPLSAQSGRRCGPACSRTRDGRGYSSRSHPPNLPRQPFRTSQETSNRFLACGRPQKPGRRHRTTKLKRSRPASARSEDHRGDFRREAHLVLISRLR